MNDFSFSEDSLAGVPAEGFQEEVFAPQLQIDDAARVTGLEPISEIEQQNFKGIDVMEPPPPIGSDLDFGDAIEVYDTLEDGPAKFALSNELDRWEHRRVLEDYKSPLGDKERKEHQQKVERLDALGMDWKAHPEARKKVVEAYGEEWTQAFEATPDEHKGRVRGEKVLEEFYARPGDKDGDSMIRFLSSVDAPEGIRESKDVWDRWNAGRQPFLKAQEEATRTTRAVERQLPVIMEELWKGNSMLQVLDKMPELDAPARTLLLSHFGTGSNWMTAVTDAKTWLRSHGFDSTEAREKELEEETKSMLSTPAGAVALSRKRGFSFNKSAAELAGDEMTSITEVSAYELGRDLVELKRKNEEAFRMVVGMALKEADERRNNGLPGLSVFARTLEHTLDSTADFYKKASRDASVSLNPAEVYQPNVHSSYANSLWGNSLKLAESSYRRDSRFEKEVIDELVKIKSSMEDSPDGSSWLRGSFDMLGSIGAYSLDFLLTKGAGTFATVANDKSIELGAAGHSDAESWLRGISAGAAEWASEMGGGLFFRRNAKWVAKRFPFMRRSMAVVAGPTDAIRREVFRRTWARTGAFMLGSGVAESMEEVTSPTMLFPVDNAIAWAFGSKDGMTVEDWWEQARQAADPEFIGASLMFGAVAGGAQIPAFAREAQISRVSAPQIMGLGVDRTEAERIANIVDPVEKNREIFQAALSMSDRASQLENVRQGFSSMKEDFSWLARQEAYQAEVELLNLPRVEDLGDGNWRFSTTVRDAEGKDSYDVLELNEQDASARMQALLHDGIRLRMLEAQQAFAVDKTIDKLEGSGKYVFEEMGRAETVETARKLAEAARLRIAEGADVNAEAADLGTRMTYGQAASMDETFKGRVELGVERGEVSSADRAHSSAYRVAMKNGQTLIRFHKGEVTVPELLEEVLETHLTEDMENTRHSLDWYSNNLRALQDVLQKEGYLSKGKDLIRKDGEVSMKDVIEGMSMLAKGDVLARAADMRLPQWMKDFLQMVRQWVSSAKALLDLGTGLHEMERRRLAGESVPIDADFAHTVYALSNNLESYWMQEGERQGEAAVKQIVKEVAGGSVSMSLSGDSSVSFSIVSIPSEDVVRTVLEMREQLKPLQGRVFTNKNTGIQAVIEARVSAKTKGKAGASQMSVANLKRFGISVEDARTIHYTAATRIHELFENAEDALFEKSYKDDPSRAGAYHLFNTVEVEGFGRFDVNVTAIAPENKERINTLYTIELTIENPSSTSEEVPLSHGGVSSDTSGVSTRNLSSYRSFVEKEKASIKKQAVADGTLMKAPNGADTNLTEDQWLAVRTEAFKNWFGDWEHDPENASKVVDENGEPLVVYHGAKSGSGFTVFDTWGEGDSEGSGSFFSANQQVASGYASEEVYSTFLNIRHPLVHDFGGSRWDSVPGRPSGYFVETEDGESEWFDNKPDADDALARYGNGAQIVEDYADDGSESNFTLNDLAREARGEGYDGVIAREVFDPSIHAGDGGHAVSDDFIVFESNQIKSATDNRGTFDGENPDITFSLSEEFPLAVSRGTQNLEVVHRIAADLRADAATWGHYAGKTDEAAFLVNVGRNVSLVKSALMHLPAGYRVAVKPYIDRLQILAELAGKGKIDETRLVNAFARREIKREMADATREDVEEAEIAAKTTAAGIAWENGKKPTQKLAKEVFEDEMEKVRKAWAENRLHELMAEVMEKAAVKLEALARDGISAGIAKMLDKVLKVRKKGGKQQKGKISMEAYTYLTEQVVPILRMTAEEKETAIREAEAELKKLEEENPDQMDGEVTARVEELNEELTRLSLYGNLEGMSVDEAEIAAKAIETFIQTEKEQWAAAQEAAAERLNAIGRKIVDVFNQTGKKADENTLRAANEKFSGKVSYKDVGDFMENMDQLLTRMGATPALKEFTEQMRDRLTNAFQQMRDSRGLRAAAVQDLYEKHITEKVMKSRKVGNLAGWATWFKTSHDTGVKLSGWVSQTAQLTLEQAREVREMDAKQRKEFIRKRWEEGMEYFSEETLGILLARLKEYEDAAARAKDAGKRVPYRKYVTAKVSFQGEESSPLVMSRDNALQVVLLSEQESYREMMKQQGYTPEVIAALRKYVGEEGLAIGYGLREMLKVQGDKIGKLYEQVTGVPFPREMNYYPARFWALDAMSDADAADMISGVPSTKGGNKAWQYVRTKHHRRLDTSVGALSVFWEATDITDHWYYTQDITTDFRGLLKRREVAESLVANLGKDDFVRLRRWVDLLERAGVVQGQAVGSVDKLMNAVYSGQAKAILAFRFETLLKQGSAVLNAWIGDPSIGFWDYLFTMAKMRNNTAEMGVIKMLKSPEFQARLNGKMDVEVLSRLKDDSSYTLAEAALMFGMNGIEFTDVFFNAVGSAALWNIKYRQAIKAGMEEGMAKDEAWQAVRNALHSAQPQTWIDKSFGGLHRGTWGRVIFYMMSENFNKTAAIYGLARMGFAKGATPKQRRVSRAKSGKVWLAYGAFNAIIGALLDYMKDDEDEWEKRDWYGYLFAAIAGPVAGMPLLGEGVEWLCSMAGLKVYTGSAGRALIDIRSGWNAGAKLWDMMNDAEEHGFQEYMMQVIRLGRVFGAVGGAASGTANKTVQAVGQYMTLGAALMNPVKTVADIVD